MKLKDFLKQFEGLDLETELKFRNIKHNGDPVIVDSLYISCSSFIRKEDGPKYVIDEWNFEKTEEYNHEVVLIG